MEDHITLCSSPSDLQQCSASVNPLEGNPQLSWEGLGVSGVSELQDSCEDSPPFLLDRFHSLTEAEKLLDELTQEKLQVWAFYISVRGADSQIITHSVEPLVHQGYVIILIKSIKC